MATEGCIQLPYGLSHYHHKIRTDGKSAQLSADSVASPTPEDRYNTKGPLHGSLKLDYNSAMGVAIHASKSMASVSTAKDWRQRTPKPPAIQPQARATRVNKNISKSHLSRQPGPGTRFGSSKQIPITIDDDDDDGMGSSFYNVSPCARRSIPSRVNRAPSIYSPDFSASTFLASPRTSFEDQDQVRSNFYSSHSRPCPAMPKALRSHTRQQQVQRQDVAPTIPPARQEENVVTLGDISDFATRQEVASLTAVAPGLPVRDLYFLFIDLKGDTQAARQHAARMGGLTSPPLSVKDERRDASMPAPENVVDLMESDSDEVMVKVDPYAPFLEYDTDEPPPDEPVRPKKQVVKAKGSSKAKSGRKRSEHVISGRRRRYRRNSINDFIVDNETVEYYTDASALTDSEDDENKASDRGRNVLEMEDLKNLRIDMEPKYAYNADILGERRMVG